MSVKESVRNYLRRRDELVRDGGRLAQQLVESYFDEIGNYGPPGQGPKARRLRADLDSLIEGLRTADNALLQIAEAIGAEPPDGESIDVTAARWRDFCEQGHGAACQLHREHMGRLGMPVPGQIDATRLTRQEYEQLDEQQRRAVLKQLGVG